jgi:hypothetical protein
MHFTEILGIIIAIIVFAMGFCLMYFARVIVDYFYWGLPFGPSALIAKTLNVLFFKVNSSNSKKIKGEDIEAWVIRIFGGLWILFGFIMIFSTIQNN